MDDKEAMYWLAVIKLAKQGEQEAQQELSEENEVRKELKLPSVEEELRKALINEELKERKRRQMEEDQRMLEELQSAKVIWKRPKK